MIAGVRRPSSKHCAPPTLRAWARLLSHSGRFFFAESHCADCGELSLVDQDGLCPFCGPKP